MRSRRGAVVTLGSSLSLSLLLGCASAPARDVDEELPELPEQWTAAGESHADVEPLVGRWWLGLEAPALDALVEEVLENNRDLEVAAARVDAAAAQAKIAGANLLPTIGVGLSSRRAKQNFLGFPIPGAEDQILSTTTTTHGLSVEIGWEADLWGRLNAHKRAAVADYHASRADRYGVELSITGLAVGGWIQLIEAGQQVALAERTLDSRRRTRERVESRYRRGVANPLDVRLARSEESLAAAALLTQQRFRDLFSRQLEVLLGRYPAGALETPGELPASPRPVPQALPSELVSRRPDLQALELRLSAAGARVAEAKRALYPRLTLTGSAGTASLELEDLLQGDFSVWALAGGLLQPLFQGGRLRAAAELAESVEEQALATYVQRILEAFGDVESSLAAETFLQGQVSDLRRAAEESGKAEELALDRYANGLDPFLSVLEAQRQSFVAESQLLIRERDRLLARVDLILALGGDFSSQLAIDPEGAL